MATGGQAPLAMACTPEPGDAFDIGVTQVTCSASDALQQSASCAFDVTVLGPPKLRATHFLAFGDSLTAGVVSSPASGGRLDPASGYVSLLQRDLQARYVTQSVEVLNAGAPGEEARHAVSRFGAVLRAHRPEVVLLMEGHERPRHRRRRWGPSLRRRPSIRWWTGRRTWVSTSC